MRAQAGIQKTKSEGLNKMNTSEFPIVGEAAVVYTSGADMTLTANGYTVANVVTPKGTCRLVIMVRLATAATMYFRSSGADGAMLDSTLIPADEWWSFELPWSENRSFSVRWSVSQTIRDIVINGKY